MKTKAILLLLLFQSTYSKDIYNGFCSVPIADLLGAPIQSFFNIQSVEKAYQMLPYGDKKGDFACPRMAQLIFNEPVIILETKKEEVKIRAPHLAYPSARGFQDTYWTLSKNITPLTLELKKVIPYFNKKRSVTLRTPLYNPTTQQTYCAGTRFVKSAHKQTSRKHSVTLYNTSSKTPSLAHIPTRMCLKTQHSKKKAQETILALCKEWAHPKKGYIPYVFGGSSIQKLVKRDAYQTKKVHFTKKDATFYERPPLHSPRAGIDCARMFTRAIQMAGVPFSATNTKGFKEVLRPLAKNESIENGDFILWKGHIAMISDIKKGLHIEARSYEDGYGKVHEIPLAEQFKEIVTTQDLVNAHFSKKRITRLNRAGKKSHFIYDLEILKLSSLW